MTFLRKLLDTKTTDLLREQLRHHRPRLSDEPVCDFCGSDAPMFVYASTRMSTGEQRACWRWLACSKCADAIEHARWFTLRDRVIDRLKTMLPADMPTQALIRTVERTLLEFHVTAVNIPE